MRKRIKWEKWVSPFNTQNEEEEEDADGEDWKSKGSVKSLNLGQTIVGPMGIVPLTEHGDPAKLYNFHMMHTNFNLSEPIQNTIQNIDGVEGLDIFSRYRARLAFGKLFDENDVQESIEAVLCKEEVSQVTKKVEILPSVKKDAVFSRLDAVKEQMRMKYAYWFIAITEKEEVKLFGNENKEVVEQKILEYPNAKICKSWD